MEAKKVMKWTGIPLNLLISKTRKREVVFARWLVFDFLVSSGAELKEAGAELSRDRTTVFNAIKKLPEKIQQMLPEERTVYNSFRAGLDRFMYGECEQDMFFSDEMLGMIANNQNVNLRYENNNGQGY